MLGHGRHLVALGAQRPLGLDPLGDIFVSKYDAVDLTIGVEDRDDVPPVQLFEDADLPSRSLRLMPPPSTNRRRGNIDFKSRRGDDI